MNVIILTGFAKGVEGVATEFGKGYSVEVTYPEGFGWLTYGLSGHTETLYYEAEELEFVDSE